jgi:hypothetical protein
MDFLTYGRGVMALWPLRSDRFLSPVTAFYGLHWSDHVVSIRHSVTLVTELAFALLTVLIVRLGPWERGGGRAGGECVGASTPEGA